MDTKSDTGDEWLDPTQKKTIKHLQILYKEFETQDIILCPTFRLGLSKDMGKLGKDIYGN